MRPWSNVGASCSLQAFDQRGVYGTMYLGMGSCHGTFWGSTHNMIGQIMKMS